MSMVHALLSLIAQTPAPARPPYDWKPFLRPMPAWSDSAWPWLLVPLCVGVAIVYKSIKCRSMKQVPKEAFVLTVWILVGMAVAATVLALIVEGMERANT